MRDGTRAGVNPSFIIWLAIVGGLTGTGVLILNLTGVNQDRDFSPAIVLIAYSSSLAAVIAVALTRRESSVGSLPWQMMWRVKARWYAIAVLGPAAVVLVADAIYQLAGGTPRWSAFFDFSALGGGIGALVAGSLGEEIGWRGFAQPLLQSRYNALRAAVIVGAIWATWHLWPIIAPGGSEHLGAADITQTYVRLISTAIIYAWIYNATHGSLLLVMVAHAGHNIAIDLMPPANSTVALMIAILHLVAAAVVVRLTGAATLGGVAAQFDGVAVGVGDVDARPVTLGPVHVVGTIRSRERSGKRI